MPPAHALPHRRPFRRLWLAYALLCLMCLPMLYMLV